MLTIDWQAVWLIGKPFLLFVGGLVVYAIFVFSFYERVSHKWLFSYELRKYEGARHPGFLRFWARLVYSLKYVFLAPLFLFLWFAILAGLLLLMNNDMLVQDGLLLGMSMLATIRISAYYSENLSVDLAKILPLALMAIFLLDRNEINLTAFWDKIQTVPTFAGTLIIYFVFTVVLEFTLRIYDAVANRE